MPCTSPLFAWLESREDGKKKVHFTTRGRDKSSKAVRSESDLSWQHITLPCGQCIGCRIDKAKEWSVRMMHEANQWEHNLFLTMTYDDENLPPDKGLHYKHVQLFLKKLRKVTGQKLRFFCVGEYGEKFGRPHWHMIAFNLEIKDFQDWGRYKTSPTVEKAWGKGFVVIGDVTADSCNYVAQYTMKKITGDQAKENYRRFSVDADTGEILDEWQVEPETARMSRRPGIGKKWFDQFSAEVAQDHIVLDGIRQRTPKYYLKKLEETDPKAFAKVHKKRTEYVEKYPVTPEQLEQRRKSYDRGKFVKQRSLDT